jgi:hypothetical protein
VTEKRDMMLEAKNRDALLDSSRRADDGKSAS